jgi:hypothetical protein
LIRTDAPMRTATLEGNAAEATMLPPSRHSRGDAVARYVSGGLDSVDGWLNSVSAGLIASLSEHQRERGLQGSSGEIGVHHGKLFILLHLLKDGGRPSFVVDLFEDQHLNSDTSGKGDYGHFIRNLEKWTTAPKAIEVFQGSSLELDPQRIVERCGRARMFSVDGGHTEECTRNDLVFAEAASEPHGVVVIDDVFNEFFPEVSMGLQAYVANGRLRPFAISPNKLYLADPAWTDAYRAFLRSRWPQRYEKTCEMFGAAVDLYGIRYASYPAWKQMLRDSPLFPQLKKLKDSIER